MMYGVDIAREPEILVYDPTATSRLHLDQVPFHADTLEGLTVGVINNAKPNFDILADEFGKWLKTHRGVARVIRLDKRTPGIPAPQQIYVNLARECDVVLTGSGD